MLIQVKSGSHDIDDLNARLAEAGARTAARQGWVELNRPLTTLALNAPLAGAGGYNQSTEPTPFGGVLALPVVSLPIGMEVKSILCTPEDIENWQVINFTFGTLNLVNPQGTFGGSNLAAFHPLTPREDKIAPFILSKTKVDVQVTAQLQNAAYRYNSVLPMQPLTKSRKPQSTKTSAVRATNAIPKRIAAPLPPAGRGVEAIFHGFSILAFQEEQVCAIQTRIEPSDRSIGAAELIHLFRQTMSERVTRQQVRHVQSKDPVQIKVTRVVAASGNLYEAVKSLFTGTVPTPTQPPQSSYPIYPGFTPYR